MAVTSKKKRVASNFIIHAVLLILVFICLFPIALVVINSFKENADIVRNPLALSQVIHLVKC